MKRLVYSPKVEVWVKADSGIIDLSPYVTDCSVSRRVDQVSSATVTIRNPTTFDEELGRPRMVWTENRYKDPITSAESIEPMFHPMDPIMISMTRLKDRPIPVFTGFCDSTPYLQLYPGPCKITASCTLKRLLHTYWDPGLDFSWQFLIDNGWLMDPQSGGVVNPVAEQQNLGTARKLTDGSIGGLLYEVLTKVGRWEDGTIWIENLPPTIVPVVERLYKDIKTDSEAAQKELIKFLHTVIGTTSLGSGGSITAGVQAATAGTGGTDYGNDVSRTVYCVGVNMHVQERYLLAAMMTGIVESSFVNLQGGDGSSVGWRQETAESYGSDVANRRNVPASARRFYDECAQHDNGQSAGQLAADVQRPAPQYRGRYQDHESDATTLLNRLKTRGCN